MQNLANQPALVRLSIFTGVLCCLWLPLAIPIYLSLQEDPNLAGILAMALLFLELLFLWRFWGKYLYRESNIFARYGLVATTANLREFLNGLAVGFCFCLSLFVVEALLGWIKIVPSAEISLVKVVSEGLLSALGIAFAEELLFRGWLLDELRRDYQLKTVMWTSALLFALLHFIKPLTEIIRTLVTFPALVILGIALVKAKRRCKNRLGMPIGLHAGLVWGYYIVNVGQLIEYDNKVPAWITGIDNNPIAGVMGLIFLGILNWAISSVRFKSEI
ncbi:CPBP family intramembrane glutamic endopeptidase [Myxosarcina sp. GI1(2024)]